MQSNRFYVKPPEADGYADLEATGYINLPNTFMQNLDPDQIGNGIMHFKIVNLSSKLTVYAGVKDFTSFLYIHMPHWMMDFIQLNPRDQVEVTFVRLPKAKRVVFQPQDNNFNKLDVRTILEYHLRSHVCLTQGSIIPIKFGRKLYKLKVLKTEPKDAVLLYHSDVETDFAPPPDQFDHHWNDPDVDSSDEENPVIVGHTYKGRVVYDKKSITHSTFASRQAQLEQNPEMVGIRRFEQGQEITPPHPKEDKPKQTQDLFKGSAHQIKKKKGKKEKVTTPAPTPQPAAPIIPDNQEQPKTESPFKGQARTLGSSKNRQVIHLSGHP